MATSQHIKASRTQILNSFPSNTFGNDGDIVCVSIKGKGSYLCIKQKGRWFSTNKLSDLRLIDKTKLEKVSLEELKIKNLTLTKNELDVSKGDLTIDVEGDIALNADGGQINFKDKLQTGVTFDIENGRYQLHHDANNYLRIAPTANGVTTFTTVDSDGTVGHLSLVPNGDLILDPDSNKILINTTDKLYFDGGTETYIVEAHNGGAGDMLNIYVGGDKMLSLDESTDTGVTSLLGTLKIAEQADASADTAGYGQLWVDTATPNELAFTDDAGTDIIGIGKYHYDTKFVGYYASAVAVFIPLNGTLLEQLAAATENEYIAMIAPYNGTIEKILWRSEATQDGTLQMDIYESSDETEVPGTEIGTKDTVLDRINDDITVDVSFASMTSGTNALVKGRVYAIKITSPSNSQDTNATVVFKWDITS
tara:strand:+ start:3845 stop:5113 length:1269 start_codon:yes stop_codon:yes gene_type:complete